MSRRVVKVIVGAERRHVVVAVGYEGEREPRVIAVYTTGEARELARSLRQAAAVADEGRATRRRGRPYGARRARR